MVEFKTPCILREWTHWGVDDGKREWSEHATDHRDVSCSISHDDD